MHFWRSVSRRTVLLFTIFVSSTLIIFLTGHLWKSYMNYSNILSAGGNYSVNVPMTSGISRHKESKLYRDLMLQTTTTLLQDLLNWPEYDDQALPIYILTAIGSNATDVDGYEKEIKLNGWLDTTREIERIKCCFMLTDRTTSVHVNPSLTYSKLAVLVATQISCPYNHATSDIVGVTVEFARMMCPIDEQMYVKPTFPKRTNNPDSFALCLKIVYDQIHNRLFIDWMEFYREMKIDKIFMFTYNITEQTDTVIRHYVQLGLVERRNFNYPRKSNRNLHEKKHAVWQDERVVVADCLQRSSGYKCMVIIDMDEFLLPKRHNSFTDIMKYLMKVHPTAAGFTFDAAIFPKDVEPDRDAAVNSSDILKYFWRTPVLPRSQARVKNIILPSRIYAKGYNTHGFSPIYPYKRVFVDNSIAAINHYRKCYGDLKAVCSSALTEDKYILKFVEKFKNRTWFPDE